MGVGVRSTFQNFKTTIELLDSLFEIVGSELGPSFYIFHYS